MEIGGVFYFTIFNVIDQIFNLKKRPIFRDEADKMGRGGVGE